VNAEKKVLRVKKMAQLKTATLNPESELNKTEETINRRKAAEPREKTRRKEGF